MVFYLHLHIICILITVTNRLSIYFLFEQVNLLFGEKPNKAVREWTKPFHEAGIQTHMLDRALNGLRMSPVPADVRKLFY